MITIVRTSVGDSATWEVVGWWSSLALKEEDERRRISAMGPWAGCSQTRTLSSWGKNLGNRNNSTGRESHSSSFIHKLSSLSVEKH